VLRGRNAELKDSASHHEIEVQKEGGRKKPSLEGSPGAKGMWLKRRKKTRGTNNLDIRFADGLGATPD